MASQVNPNNIDGAYPVAGQDNDSQGFRDNFTNIRNNFTFIKAEVEDLQNKAVLKSALVNSTLDNNFSGNTISNPSFKGWFENYYSVGAVTGTATITFTNSNFQKITLGASTTLTFSFPSYTNGSYASVKLWVNVTNASYTLSFATAPTLGDADTIAGYNAGTITFNPSEIANNTDYFFEIFTFDGGATLGIRDLIRNRDIDLSGLSITGNLTVDSITSTGNITAQGNVRLGSSTSSNVVVVATTTSTSTSTGALVVLGGVGIQGNLNLQPGSTSVVPIKFGVGATGGNITVPQQGALEANLGIGATGTASNVLLFTPTSSTSSGEALVPVTHYIVLGSNVGLNNGVAPVLGNAYSIFGGPVSGTDWMGNTMLAAGTTYEFDVHSMIRMAAAPAGAAIGFSFGGNATTTYYNYEVISYPVSGLGNVLQSNISHYYGTSTLPPTGSGVLNTQAYLNFAIRARGLIRINGQGTVVPVVQWLGGTPPGQVATAVQGSYMKFTPLGTEANIIIGNPLGTSFV